MSQKIIIAELTDNEKFINIVDNKGNKFGVNKSFDGNKEFVEMLLKAQQGDEIEAEIKEFGNNKYLNPIKKAGAAGAKGYAPKVITDVEMAIAAATAAANSFSLNKEATTLQITERAEALFTFIRSKKSTPAA